MGKTVLDWLKEMKPKLPDALYDRQQCRRVELPRFLELPRRYGITYGCLEDGYVNAAGDLQRITLSVPHCL
jgi:hypothetical protein